MLLTVATFGGGGGGTPAPFPDTTLGGFESSFFDDFGAGGGVDFTGSRSSNGGSSIYIFIDVNSLSPILNKYGFLSLSFFQATNFDKSLSYFLQNNKSFPVWDSNALCKILAIFFYLYKQINNHIHFGYHE